jgi:hypothetical protein
MRIIFGCEPQRGLVVRGPFADDGEIGDRCVEDLEHWIAVPLDEPDRTVRVTELAGMELANLEGIAEDEGCAVGDYEPWRDEYGVLWTFSDATSTTWNLTTGTAPPTS